MKSFLIYAIGNPARGDDGLAPALAEKLDYPDTTIVYQPNIEDAELIKNYRTVLFIDAAHNLKGEYKITQIFPQQETPLFSHGLQLPILLALTKELYGYCPNAYQLALRGENFELGSTRREINEWEILKKEIKALKHTGDRPHFTSVYAGALVVILLIADLLVFIPALTTTIMTGFFLGHVYGAITARIGLSLTGATDYLISHY